MKKLMTLLTFVLSTQTFADDGQWCASRGGHTEKIVHLSMGTSSRSVLFVRASRVGDQDIRYYKTSRRDMKSLLYTAYSSDSFICVLEGNISQLGTYVEIGEMMIGR